MHLRDTVKEHVEAGFPGLWIESEEHDDAQAEIAALCRAEEWTIAAWDADRGLRSDAGADPGMDDPLAVLRALPALSTGHPVIVVMRNLHQWLSPLVAQALDTQLAEGKTRAQHIVVLAPVVQIPRELERQFVVLEHEMPGRAALETIARRVGNEPGETPGAGPELDALLDAAAGLTRLEAESAFALSLVRYDRIRPETVWEIKAQTLKKSGLMTLHRGGETFADLGGLDALKSYCRRALRPDRPKDAPARGVMLLGVPGTGKSAFAKALGNETGRPTLVLDVGALMGSLVGQSEGNTRQALRIADAMAPCVLFVDEVEKGLAGLSSSGQSDGGTTARVFGSILTWLADHTSDVFVVATSNDVTKLPPEFARPGRFNSIWFLDHPGPVQREAIWAQYTNRFDLDTARDARPDDRHWTGAEIRACCETARALGIAIAEAARYVVPVHSTGAETIQSLRQWSTGRCLDAETGGIYSHRTQAGGPPTAEAPTARKIQRKGPRPEPGLN